MQNLVLSTYLVWFLFVYVLSRLLSKREVLLEFPYLLIYLINEYDLLNQRPLKNPDKWFLLFYDC